MIIYRRSENDHDGELCEEDTVEDEGLGFVPCFEALRNDVAARVYYERGETGRGNRRELHDGEAQVGSNVGRGSRTWLRWQNESHKLISTSCCDQQRWADTEVGNV